MVVADAEAFAALVRRVFSGLSLAPPPSAGRITSDDIRSHFAGGGGGFTTDPDAAGLLWLETDGGLYVSRVAVEPRLQRQGLATRMLAAAEAEAERRGLPRLWLATRLALTGNRRLFAAFGFKEAALHCHPGFTEPTFVDMVKQIDHELIRPASV